MKTKLLKQLRKKYRWDFEEYLTPRDTITLYDKDGKRITSVFLQNDWSLILIYEMCFRPKRLRRWVNPRLQVKLNLDSASTN